MSQDEKNIEEFQYVVLGGGVGGGYVVHEFVKEGVDKNQICLISRESVLPYERPALSKGYLIGKAKLPGFNCAAFFNEPHNQDWYDNHGITVKLNTTVIDINFDGNTLKCDNNQLIKYKTLILATGCETIKFSDFGAQGSNLEGLYYLRNYNDAELLYKKIEINKNAEVLMVGGGYIGMEVASALISAGVKKVTMVLPESYMMERLFTPEIAKHYENYYISKGVTYIKGGIVDSFLSDNNKQVNKVKLKNGRIISADYVVIGIGARPCTSLYKDKLSFGYETRGVLVNSKLQTNIKNVYAVGDIISYPCKFTNRITRVEHVKHARASAQHAVKIILNKTNDDYIFLPAFYSRIFDKSWVFYGDNPKQDSVVVFGDFKPKLLAFWINKNDQIDGAFLESGDNNEEIIIENCVRNKIKLNKNDFSSNLKIEDILSQIKSKS